MPLPRVTLPRTGLSVSAICLGLADLGTRVSGARAERVLSAFLEAGGNFVDTAHCYAFWRPDGLGASERELGRLLDALGARDQVIVSTKGGHPDGGLDYPRPDAYLAPEVISRDLADSLERLRADRVDLYLLHRDDPRVPVAEILDPLRQAVADGRVGHIGASNWSTRRLAEANGAARRLGWPEFAVAQCQWSLAEPTWQEGPEPTMRRVADADAAWYAHEDIGVMAYSATAGGYFAGNPGAGSAYGTPGNAGRRARATELADKLGVTPTQVALAFLLRQEAVTVPIVGTLSVDHLRDAIGAVEVPLTREDVRWLQAGPLAQR